MTSNNGAEVKLCKLNKYKYFKKMQKVLIQETNMNWW